MTLRSSFFIKICQISLIKHAKEHSEQLHNVLLQQPSLAAIDQHKLTFLISLDEIHKKALDEDRKVVSIYGSFNLPGSSNPENKPEEEYTTMK